MSDNATDDVPVEDVLVTAVKPLIPPAILQDELPITPKVKKHVLLGRKEATRIINGEDDRLLVIVGPCSIHDYKVALEYGQRLKNLVDKHKEDLMIVMRVYFEKPRTTVGWKGFINDPHLDGTYSINKGLRLSRSLLLELNDMGLHAACELLDTISPQFFADLVSWAAIGARTTESQIHRELASGMSMPVGFKNGTDGRVGIAIDAIRAAAHPHHFMGVTKQGFSAIIATKGNPHNHVVLRGSNSGPNYEEKYVVEATQALVKAGVNPRLMVDCSHGNSSKVHKNQIIVAKDLANQISKGSQYIMGVMVESNIEEGRQDIPKDGPAGLRYGQSITDACICFEDTELVLDILAEATRARRKLKANGHSNGV
jgi:3-deoxy-7-phosphoheptulonate synthase